MKFKRKLLLLLACLFVIPSTANASTYIGEYCWTVQHPDGMARYFRLGVSHIGDSHYTVNGVWTKGDLSLKSPVHGNAEFIDGNLEISAIRTDSSVTDMYFRAFHFDLDSSFNGTFKSIAINQSTGGIGGNVAPAVFTNCATLP